MEAKENALRIIKFDKPERVSGGYPRHGTGYRGCNHEGFEGGGHHLPVARQAVLASSCGLRFQGQGYFLTDARTHRGTSVTTDIVESGVRAFLEVINRIELGRQSGRIAADGRAEARAAQAAV